MTSDGTRDCAMVTGASSGIGRAVAARLSAAGHRVVAVARRLDRLEELAASYEPLVFPLKLDVRDGEAVADAVAHLPPDFADVRILVNNAGVSKGFGPVSDAAPEHWHEMIETNVLGVLHCTRALLPTLEAAGRGHIVNVGSIAAHYPYLGGNVYAATKAFAHQLSLNLRVDLGGSGIRVSCIDPGMVRTEFALVRFDGDQQRAAAHYDGVHPLTAEDVAEAVCWCLSRPARVNVNLVELMPADQPFGLGLRRPDQR